MKRIPGLSLGILIVLAAAGTGLIRISAQPRPAADEVEKLHREALVWDCHNDLSYRVLYEGLDIGDRLPGGHVDIPRLREGHVDVQVVALFIQSYLYPDKCARQAFQLLEAMTKSIEKNAAAVELARTGADIERI
ncbi:MAG: hypothetical protein FJY82_15690, partial [Candidatus Aminicenantes bacterium]|nr:hypothetical protein [Candidatus Aminicenantes bacterium]